MTPTLTEIVTVDEAISRYPDEWIFMQVTAEDEYYAASAGIVLAHHPRRGVLQRSIMKEIAKHKGEQVRYYVFQAYPHTWSRERWTEILARAAHSDVGT